MHSLVTSIFLYACESWTLTAELLRRIQAMEMRCYCKTLCISYKDDVANEKVCAKIQQAIGTHEDLLMIVKRRKLQWYGHVSRSSGLTKTILQGTVKIGRRQGRQRKRWEDNIREWKGQEFGRSERTVENMEKWVSQRPSRLMIMTMMMMMNGRHGHTTAVCVSFRWSGGLRRVRLPVGSWHGLPRW